MWAPQSHREASIVKDGGVGGMCTKDSLRKSTDLESWEPDQEGTERECFRGLKYFMNNCRYCILKMTEVIVPMKPSKCWIWKALTDGWVFSCWMSDIICALSKERNTLQTLVSRISPMYLMCTLGNRLDFSQFTQRHRLCRRSKVISVFCSNFSLQFTISNQLSIHRNTIP